MSDFELLIEEIKQKENAIYSLKEKYEGLSEALKSLSINKGFFNESYYMQMQEDKEKSLYEIKENENIIKQKIIEIKDCRSETGKLINDDMDLLKDEFERYNKNKSLNNVFSVIKEIKDMIEDVEKNLKKMEILNQYIEDYAPLTKENKLLEKTNLNNEALILKRELEFSKYTLNNKQGFSLKNFLNNYKKEIKIVYEYYNEDLDKTIEYLQKTHGLCAGSKIEKNTFKNNCPELFSSRIANFNVYWDNILIKGSSKKDIFLEVIKKVGIGKIHEKLSHLYNTSFKISRFEIKSDYGFTHKILYDNDLYYVKLHANSAQYKEFLEIIKSTFNLSNLVLDFN